MTTTPANAIPVAKDARPYTGPGAVDIAQMITATLEGHISFQPFNVAVTIWPKGQPETVFVSMCSLPAEAAKAFAKAKEISENAGAPQVIIPDPGTAADLLRKSGR